MQKITSALTKIDLATAGWKTILGLVIVGAALFGIERGAISQTLGEYVAGFGLIVAGVGLAAKAKRKKKVKRPPLPPDALALALVACLALVGCVTPTESVRRALPELQRSWDMYRECVVPAPGMDPERVRSLESAVTNGLAEAARAAAE